MYFFWVAEIPDFAFFSSAFLYLHPSNKEIIE